MGIIRDKKEEAYHKAHNVSISVRLNQFNYQTKDGTEFSKERLILRIKTWVLNWICITLAGKVTKLWG